VSALCGVVLVVVGLVYFGCIFFLLGALWHSNWLNGTYNEYNDVYPNVPDL